MFMSTHVFLTLNFASKIMAFSSTFCTNNQLRNLTCTDDFPLYYLESGQKLLSYVTGVHDKFCTTHVCAITPPILGKVIKHIPVDTNMKQ